MSLFRALRRRARHIVGPTLGASLAIYFAYHAIHGDRGLIAWWHLSRDIDAARTAVAETAIRREILEQRVALLRPESLNQDMLDERARLMLNLVGPDEFVILEHEAVQGRRGMPASTD